MPLMDRPRGRSGGKRDSRPPRRTPPPNATGLEANFFDEAMRERRQLVVTLIDGTKVCGTVEEYDRDQLTIEDSSGPIIIRKSEIRYLAEE
jgi:sRNA-binding regulator protein Hfq